MDYDKNNIFTWYIAGLHFQCFGCGQCCSGPEEGFIWVSDEEVLMLANRFEMSEQEFRKKYTRSFGKRTTLIEEPKSKDCIFLCSNKGGKGCSIYDIRPNQCRTWPFWDSNLESPDDWNLAATKCPGINQGKLYTFDEIEKIRKQKKWW